MFFFNNHPLSQRKTCKITAIKKRSKFDFLTMVDLLLLKGFKPKIFMAILREYDKESKCPDVKH